MLPEPLRSVVWNDGERRPRAGYRLLGHVLLVVLLSVAGLAALGPAVAALAAAGLLAWLPPGAPVVGNVLFLATVIVAATLAAARYLDRRPFADLGLAADAAWRADLGFGLALGAGLQAGIFLTLSVAGWTTVRGAGIVAPAELATVGLGLVAMLAVGLYEELLFRGYYLVNLAEGLRGLPGLDARRGALLAAGLTSLAFGGLHWLNAGATARSTALVAGYGGYLAAAYLLTGELAVPVGFHVAWNFVQGYVFGLPISGLDAPASLLATRTAGPELATGGHFGPEAGLVGLAWVLLSIPTLAWWVRRTRGDLAVRREVATPALRWRGGGAATGGPEDGPDGDDPDAIDHDAIDSDRADPEGADPDDIDSDAADPDDVDSDAADPGGVTDPHDAADPDGVHHDGDDPDGADPERHDPDDIDHDADDDRRRS